MLDEEVKRRADAPVVQALEVFRGRFDLVVAGCETPANAALQDERERKMAEDRRAEEAQRKRNQRWRDLRALGLPLTERDEYALLDETLAETAMLRTVRLWRENPNSKPMLVLCGPVGRGKTIAAADALVNCEAPKRYVGARELERISMAKFGDAQEAYEQLLHIRFLVIDDLGREDDLGRMQTALLDAVDMRRRTGLLTILATNFSRKSFEQRYSDARLQSRLAECAQWFADAGEDMRRAK